MFFRIIAFLVGLIAVIAGIQNYDPSVSSSPIPLITGGLVMLIAIFNLIPQFKRCAFCGKKLPKKKISCPFCKNDQPSEEP
jgi:hypothetical protein